MTKKDSLKQRCRRTARSKTVIGAQTARRNRSQTSRKEASMTHNKQRSLPHLKAMLPTEQDSHLELELAVAVKSRKEQRKIRKHLKLLGFVFLQRTLIVDFVEPSRSVTSRVRFEMPIDGTAEQAVTSYMGKKKHPVEGILEPFVRQELDPKISAETAVELLVRAIAANGGKPIPYYCKKRRYFGGVIDDHQASVALDKPKGLLRRFPKRCLEAEVQLPLSTIENDPELVLETVRSIATFIFNLIGEDRKIEISYRRKVKKTWKKRGMRTWKTSHQLTDLTNGLPPKRTRQLLSAIAQAA